MNGATVLRHLDLNIDGLRVRISSNYAPFIRDLRTVAAPLRVQEPLASPDLHYTALRVEGESPPLGVAGSATCFRLDRDRTNVCSTGEPLALLGTLHLDIFDQWRARLGDLLIHGCAVGYGERALLFCGTQSTGKTTLITHLINCGASYLTDDFALIEPETLQIKPVLGPIQLKQPLFPFDHRRLKLYSCKSGPLYYAIPQPSVIPHPGQRFTIQALIFPEYSVERDVALLPLTPAQGAFELMSHSYNQPMLGARGFEIVTRLAQAVPAFRLYHSDLDQTRKVLQSLVTPSVS